MANIEYQGKCVLIRGEILLDDAIRLMKDRDESYDFDPHLSRMMGLTMAFGPRSELEAIRKQYEPIAIERAAMSLKAKGIHISDSATQWLAVGQRGESSDSLFAAVLGVFDSQSPPKEIPSDLYDFERCVLLCEMVPEIMENKDKARLISPRWNALMDRWDELEELLTRVRAQGADRSAIHQEADVIFDAAYAAEKVS